MARTVLIVEDSESSATPLEIALAEISGIEVLMLSNARDALDIFCNRARDIAALVTDLHLPLMDGFELIEEVRRDKRYSGMPILVVTADTDPTTPDRVRRLGANACFPKPYSPAEIRQKLENLLHGF